MITPEPTLRKWLSSSPSAPGFAPKKRLSNSSSRTSPGFVRGATGAALAGVTANEIVEHLAEPLGHRLKVGGFKSALLQILEQRSNHAPQAFIGDAVQIVEKSGVRVDFVVAAQRRVGQSA